MADSNKILTVSYGTFSCTLEGFDDAFTTMKAIAEYFRDLAADDRYFGAEPPTPDADMLAQLASRAAARRVEARQDENGIVLRQDTAALSAPEPAKPAAHAAPVSPVAEEADEAEEVATEEEAAPVAEAEAAEDEHEEITATEDEAPAEASADAADEEEADEVAEAFAEFEAIADADEDEAPAPRPVLAQNKTAVVQRRAKPASAKRVQPSRPRVQVSASRPARVAPAAPAAAPHPDQNSVAAKLARIRGVVSKIDKGEVASGYSEDEHADGATEAVTTSLAEAFEADLADDVTEAVTQDAPDAEATRAAIAAEIAEREGHAAVQDEDADIDVSAAFDFVERDAEEDEEAFFADTDEGEEEEAFDEDAFFADAPEAEEDTAEDEDAPVAAEAEVQPRPVARVLKVKRRDFEAAVEDGTLEEEVEVPEAIARGESSLSPEDEADLQDELQALEAEIARGAEVEAEAEADDEDEDPFGAFMEDDEDDLEEDIGWDLDDEDDEDEAEPEIAIAADPAADGDDAFDADLEDGDDHAGDTAAIAADTPVNPRSRLLRGADDDMDRILKETDNQLGDSDGTRRRSAIAHLRAAVAATKAEKQAGGVTEDDEREVADVYRDDLAQVVRPRRPVARGDSPARRGDDRPAPLKLVAEQRVDIPGAEANAGPVRPRRVRMADIAKHEKLHDADMDADAEAHARAAAANAASFNEFAERVGAAGLPDLLEAAASYLSFVEGRDQFTRPQLMVKARQVMEDEFSREDGLRHFGRLLREGKLRKVAAGHFTVSDRINFRPEERAAG